MSKNEATFAQLMGETTSDRVKNVAVVSGAVAIGITVQALATALFNDLGEAIIDVFA